MLKNNSILKNELTEWDGDGWDSGLESLRWLLGDAAPRDCSSASLLATLLSCFSLTSSFTSLLTASDSALTFGVFPGWQ